MLEHWLTSCPAQWRRMGYLREQIAIDARLARCRREWSPHLEATRAQISEGVRRCVSAHRARGAAGRPRCALVLGAGLVHDLPLEELCANFERVVLADLVHRPAQRRRAGKAGALCVEWDVTGMLRALEGRSGAAEGGDAAVEAELLRLVVKAEPGLPVETQGEPELVVSANVASQLMLLPAEWLGASEDFEVRLAEAAARRHLGWLAARRGIHVLVTDVARGRVPADGACAAGSWKELFGVEGPGAPEARWRWRIAPAPEVSATHHLEHEVAAWVW